MLAFLAVTGEYIAPFGSPLGQVLLVALLALYVATLVWMRTMATGRPLPRFIGNTGQFTKTEAVAENPRVGAP